MIKKFFFAVAMLASFTAVDVVSNNGMLTGSTCMAAAPNDGTYMRTSYSVMVYSESGHSNGSFAVYLHGGRKYIDFRNTWICIQGTSRFAYCGNWYIVK